MMLCEVQQVFSVRLCKWMVRGGVVPVACIYPGDAPYCHCKLLVHSKALNALGLCRGGFGGGGTWPKRRRMSGMRCSGTPMPIMSWQAGMFTPLIHSVTGCSTCAHTSHVRVLLSATSV